MSQHVAERNVRFPGVAQNDVAQSFKRKSNVKWATQYRNIAPSGRLSSLNSELLSKCIKHSCLW
jgi:hypothetical protein